MISAIVLAAGESKRMGTQKLLLPFSGDTVVGHIVHQIVKSQIDQVWVVTGCDQEGVQKTLSDKPVSFAHNPDYARGMLSSVRCDIKALSQTSDACMAVLGDQPSLTSALINELIQAFHATPLGLVVPSYEGRRGHPLLVSSIYFEEILSRFDDVGLRGLLHVYPDQVKEHPVSSDIVLSDMDYPSDYLREINRLP